MRDQADQLRRIVRETLKEQHALGSGVPLVVVSSGGDHSGATTVAMGLSHELARLGKRTVLVDANPKQPDVTSRFQLNASGSLAEVLAGTRSAIEVLCPIAERLSVLPARCESPDMRGDAVERLFAELRSLHSQADMVILDVGSGTSPWVERHWQSAEQILLVTAAEPQAIQDSYAALKLLGGGDSCEGSPLTDKIHLVVNRCANSQLGQRIAERFVQTSSYFLGRPLHSTSTICQADDNPQAHQRALRLLAADVIGTNCSSPASFAA